MWSAGADPRVLTARAAPHDGGDGSYRFDRHDFPTRVVVGPTSEHMLIAHRSVVVRLDVIEGTVLDGPVSLRVEVSCGPRLPAQLSAAAEIGDPLAGATHCLRRHRRLADVLLALQAHDARECGASLREIACELLGPGEWPGDGEHRKSRARRLIETGRALVLAGPGAVLACR